ncbi:hypothetical protein [Pectobacterium punjabense]|uniref:hypothetical protein n=1 Tax=Pectobacterium punjabense TaxID=2108399 RepID=UPI0024053323|nr:hypothetical protein [Pectobacterium punjabense]MDG0798909.1 hypothetical protein [Pectobacterium punjabense]
MPNNHDLIYQEILERKQIKAIYQGYYREMCPHVLGTKNGRNQALFYQFGGESSQGPIIPDSPSNWRCIQIDGLTDISIHEGPWHTGQNHSRPQTCVDFIEIEIPIE